MTGLGLVKKIRALGGNAEMIRADRRSGIHELEVQGELAGHRINYDVGRISYIVTRSDGKSLRCYRIMDLEFLV